MFDEHRQKVLDQAQAKLRRQQSDEFCEAHPVITGKSVETPSPAWQIDWLRQTYLCSQ